MKNLLLFMIGLLVVNLSRGQNSFGQYDAKLAVSGGDSTAQSFLFVGGSLDSISIPVFSRYHPTDHAATLFVLDGDGVNGTVLHSQATTVKGLNKFYSEASLDTLSISELEVLWVQVQDSIDSGQFKFVDLATTFSVGQYFSSGSLTFLVVLDSSVSSNGYRWVTAFANCFSSFCSPIVNNPYPNGIMYWGTNGSFGPKDLNADMAFEVFWHSTVGIKKFEIPIQNGVLNVPLSWRGATLGIYDLSGRTLLLPSIVSFGQEFALPKNQVIFLRLVHQGRTKTIKLLIR